MFTRSQKKLYFVKHLIINAQIANKVSLANVFELLLKQQCNLDRFYLLKRRGNVRLLEHPKNLTLCAMF